MNKAKVVMALYTFAAVISMMGIGVSLSLAWLPGDKYVTTGYIGVIACIFAVCFIFMTAFKQKRRFKEQGLL